MKTVAGHRVAIRELVEFIARRGDINFRFSSRSSALEGIKGHRRLQASRGEGYVPEKDVTTRVQIDCMEICLSGRVDGYFPDRRPLEVEEIKTVRVPAAAIPEAIRHLHWSQAMMYAHLLVTTHAAESALVRLCYLNLDDDSEEAFESEYSRVDLDAHFYTLMCRYASWLRRMAEWQARRDEGIGTMTFPYGDYRAGQREMAVSAWRAMRDERCTVLQAPTGIGKTMATLFPAVKALRELDYEKVFFLTAKTSGQESAERTLAELKAKGLPLRDITLTARDKVCFNPGSPCDGQHCEYAAGYYDRLPAAVEEVMAVGVSLGRDAVETLARRHRLCPFELALDLSRVCDVVICDYNYAFDPGVYLRRYFEGNGRRFVFLVDEAHNLVERGREMFSANISKDRFLSLRRELGSALPQLAKSLARVNESILALRRPLKAQYDRDGYLRLDNLPEAVITAVRGFCQNAEQWLDDNHPAPFQPDLLTLYFDSLKFLRTADWFGDDYACLLEKTDDGMMLRLYNVNPAKGLGQGMQRAAASVCFSATMMPQTYFQSLMGVGEDTAWYRLGSPFDPANLGVFSAPYISTAYRDRAASLESLVSLLADVVSARRGNYLVFLPSYAYLSRVVSQFEARHQQVRCIRQHPGMSEADREEFLAAFQEDRGQDTLVGFAVLGGAFGEAVDLRGSRLIGAIVVGVGLPGMGAERDLIRSYFDDTHGAGFEFAYQYPGMNRVLQTAGRVIRSESDRGIVCLVDTRFAQARYRSLMPVEWQVQQCRCQASLSEAIRQFWAANDR